MSEMSEFEREVTARINELELHDAMKYAIIQLALGACRYGEVLSNEKIARLEAECAALKSMEVGLRLVAASWIDMYSLDCGDYTQVKTDEWDKLCDVMVVALQSVQAMQAGEKP